MTIGRSSTTCLAVGLAMTLGACAGTTPGATFTSTSAGEVGFMDDAGGTWMDGSGGMWMDATGVVRMGGPGGMRMGLQATDVARMSQQHIVAHLALGDSLEIALSRLGERAQSAPVREFAQRMVTEHAAHLQMGMQLAQQAGITPVMAPMDTMELQMASRMMTRLGTAPQGQGFDRQFMGAEVMMHRHMLNDLRLMQPQATGAVRQLIDQTIPIVEQHLAQAQTIWRTLGGGMGMGQGRGAGGTAGAHSGHASP
ncbi:MAG TPA: DUF4142 domain-containing protein [Gemmatimonadaceae bacterium]|nr:DUF4142 domain-containing protein [Gemmatimonadaceae bacterium]